MAAAVRVTGKQDDMASKFVEGLRDQYANITGGKRTGPFSRRHSELVLSLARARNTMAQAPETDANRFLMFAAKHAGVSKSQIFQDAFALYVLGSKRNGYFCDFGATNGVFLSNSYCLETSFGWTGICAEPARVWHDELRANRPNARIETECVWSRTGEELSFIQSQSRELSTLSAFGDSDGHARRRRKGVTYPVKTVSLNDMLARHQAPLGFDFLSIDTEGSELAILQTFDIAKYQPKIVVVEHNYTSKRNDILALMTAAGYTRALAEVSLFDDWYLAPGVQLPKA
jgi:FkbM family methyltransferase